MQLFHINTIFPTDLDVFLFGMMDVDGGLDVFWGGDFWGWLLF